MNCGRRNSLVSVVVPVYGVEKYVNQCIDSVINQTYSNIDVVLVDDGSPDSCGFMCDRWAQKDSRVCVIHKENGGLSDARNTGIGIVRGEYLVFVDSDDWLKANMVDCLVQAAFRYEADCCIGSMFEYYGEKHSIKKDSRLFFLGDSEAALKLLYEESYLPVSACNKLIKRSVWGDIRFPVGKLYEDAFTTYKVFHRSKKVVRVPDCLYYYRERPGSIMNSKFNLHAIQRQEAWKENYLFCKEKYPNLVSISRSYWLEHIPPLIYQFPQKLNYEEVQAKRFLKKEIISNLAWAIFHMRPAAVFHQFKALIL